MDKDIVYTERLQLRVKPEHIQMIYELAHQAASENRSYAIRRLFNKI